MAAKKNSPLSSKQEAAISKLGEQLAINALRQHGFANMRSIRFDGKTSYGHLFASREGHKYVIHIVTRKRFDNNGTFNDRHNLIRAWHLPELAGSPCPVEHWYGGIPAWVDVSLDKSGKNRVCSIYFGTVEQLKGKRDIHIGDEYTKEYLCLADNANVEETAGCNILMIIPLLDEFEEFCRCFKVVPIPGRYDTRYSIVKGLNRDYRVWCFMIGKRGNTAAASTTSQAILYATPRLIVLLGMAGRLDANLLLGDVVVADRIVSYESYSKAEQKKGEYHLRRCREDLHPPSSLSKLARGFFKSNEALFMKWQKQVSNYKNGLALEEDKLKFTRTVPDLKVGPLASGNVVGKSRAFAKELQLIDTDLEALEMESAGVAESCGDNQDYIVIRGISDFADRGKSRLDRMTQGAFRRLAMRSAAMFLQTLLQSPDFQKLYSVEVQI